MEIRHGNLTKNLMAREMDFLRSGEMPKIRTNVNNDIRANLNIKNSALGYIRYKQLNRYSHVVNYIVLYGLWTQEDAVRIVNILKTQI